MPCPLSTPEAPCKKIPAVDQIINKCSLCTQVFCKKHSVEHGSKCADEKRLLEQTKLREQLKHVVKDKMTYI